METFTAAVLAASIMIGGSYADMGVVTDTYDIIRIPAHAVNWNADTEKLSELTSLDGVVSGAAGDRILYSVRFPVGSSEPYGDWRSVVSGVVPKGLRLSVRGYASPDGKSPAMQYDLAVSRMARIKRALEDIGYEITADGGEVCRVFTNRADCWRADIFVTGGNYE